MQASNRFLSEITFMRGFIEDGVRLFVQIDGWKYQKPGTNGLRLQKSIQGCKQSANRYNSLCIEKLAHLGFDFCTDDSQLFRTGTIIAAKHVDDMLMIATEKDALDFIKSNEAYDMGTKKYIEITPGTTHTFLGIAFNT